MNLRITDVQVRRVCRELLVRNARVSGRALRRELHEQLGAVGQTARIFSIWREECEAHREHARAIAESAHRPQLPTEVLELQKRLAVAEAKVAETLERAERAELREQSHQDRWGMEIDRLRQELRAQPGFAAEVRKLQTQVIELTVENAALCEKLKSHSGLD